MQPPIAGASDLGSQLHLCAAIIESDLFSHLEARSDAQLTALPQPRCRTIPGRTHQTTYWLISKPVYGCYAVQIALLARGCLGGLTDQLQQGLALACE